ncbi:MAG: Ig-like domain repeat protein [Candidatus Bathyarchaeaceae archaeon]
MKKSIVRMRKGVQLTFLVLILGIVVVSVGRVSPIPTITQANPVTTVYLNPPTINGTAIGVNNTVTVNIMIRDAYNVYAWQAGLTFNPDLLNCTGFFEGEFLSDAAGPDGTGYFPGVINNTAGTVGPYGCTLLGDYWASGSGRLAYVTFKVKAAGVSDIHLSDIQVMDYDTNLVRINIIDVYTAFVEATPHTVVTVSNLTGATTDYLSGFYDHAFNPTLKEISFKVAGPYTIAEERGILKISRSFSNVTIPKVLLPPPEDPYVWAVLINGASLSLANIIKSENATHTSIYFTFSPGINDAQITTRFMPSTISIDLSKKSISLGESVTISGNVTGADDTVRANVTVTIQNRTRGATEWGTLTTVKTKQNGEYTYEWEPGKIGTYEVMASWEGDTETLRADSEVLTLTVKGAPRIPLEIVVVVVVAIIIIVAIVVYFVKIRKPKSE